MRSRKLPRKERNHIYKEINSYDHFFLLNRLQQSKKNKKAYARSLSKRLSIQLRFIKCKRIYSAGKYASFQLIINVFLHLFYSCSSCLCVARCQLVYIISAYRANFFNLILSLAVFWYIANSLEVSKDILI